MLAIIPARGGSKGLPGKNIIDFCGKPLIAYTIEAALKAESISKVLVTTDSEEISDVAKQYGASVPFLRPKHLSGDTARAIDVYLHAVESIGQPVDSFVALLPTCPLRSAADIDSAVNIFQEKKASSVISYTQEAHPIKWHQYIGDDGRFESIFEESIDNRQAERVSFYPNGAIYVFTTDLLKSGHYYSNNSYSYIMPRNRSVDIDTIDDLKYAEFLKITNEEN